MRLTFVMSLSNLFYVLFLTQPWKVIIFIPIYSWGIHTQKVKKHLQDHIFTCGEIPIKTDPLPQAQCSLPPTHHTASLQHQHSLHLKTAALQWGWWIWSLPLWFPSGTKTATGLTFKHAMACALGVGHTGQYAEHVSQKCTLENYVHFLTSVTPMNLNLTKKK